MESGRLGHIACIGNSWHPSIWSPRNSAIDYSFELGSPNTYYDLALHVASSVARTRLWTLGAPKGIVINNGRA